MARHFEPPSGELRTDIGAANIAAGPATLALIVKLDAQDDWRTLVSLHDSGGSGNFLRLETHPSNLLHFGSSIGSIESSTLTLTTANGWCLVAVTKATGSATPRFHKYVYSTNTWTHENGGGGVADGAAPGVGSSIRYGEWQDTDDLDGDVELSGIWNVVLTDAEVENLAHSLKGWFATATAPLVVHLFNQASIADPVRDLTGGGADETLDEGTSVGVAPHPPAPILWRDPIRIVPLGAPAPPSSAIPAMMYSYRRRRV